MPQQMLHYPVRERVWSDRKNQLLSYPCCCSCPLLLLLLLAWLDPNSNSNGLYSVVWYGMVWYGWYGYTIRRSKCRIE